MKSGKGETSIFIAQRDISSRKKTRLKVQGNRR